MNITPENICPILVNSTSVEQKTSIFTTHLRTLGHGILLLNPRGNKTDRTLLFETIECMRDYINQNDIDSLEDLQPFVDMWLNLISSDSEVLWHMCMDRLPERLRHRISIMAIYEHGELYLNSFTVVDVLSHLDAIVYFRNQQSLESYNKYCYTKKIDYSKLKMCLDGILLHNKNESWYNLRKLGNLIDVLYSDPEIKITSNNLSVLLFEVHYLEYVIQAYDTSINIEPYQSLDALIEEKLQHLKIPSEWSIPDLHVEQTISYLEYNYSSRCPADFFRKLHLYLGLINAEDISLDTLKIVYASCVHKDYSADGVQLPEFYCD